MRRIRQVLIHCAYVAALIDVGACSSEDGLGSSPEVQASGDSQGLFRTFKKHHVKKKKKHHWDDCGEDAGTSEDAGTPRMCQSLALHVDSIKHREDTARADGTINVRVPEQVSAFYWGKHVQAELTFQQGDTRVVCTYAAARHQRHHGSRETSSSLELESCDNGAKAGDSVAIDSATLSLDCSRFVAFAKVWVELHEIEPCDETPEMPECDPSDLDDNNPCTNDVCGANGIEHQPVARGTSCADDNVCNGDETCDDQGACRSGDAPTPPQAGPCQTRACDPQRGWVLANKPAGTSCADNDRCNGQETCSASGTCGGGEPLTCGDDNVCNGEERCDPQSGCVGGMALNADDGDACTSDACDPARGVTHEPVETDDDNLCTVDACDRATGPTHVQVPTDDGNACTTDGCDPQTGPTHEPTNEGGDCGMGGICRNGTCIILQ